MVIIMNKKDLVRNIGSAILIFMLFNYSWLFQLLPVAIFDLDVDNLSDKVSVMLSCFSSLLLAGSLFIIYKELKKCFR